MLAEIKHRKSQYNVTTIQDRYSWKRQSRQPSRLFGENPGEKQGQKQFPERHGRRGRCGVLTTSSSRYLPSLRSKEGVEGMRKRRSRYPRAYARGTWDLKPTIQLCFTRVDFLLKLNISFDDVLVDSDRGGEKTDGPQFVPPVYLLNPGKTLAHFPTRVGFELANDVRHRILWGSH
jgi:hypothetical protein